VNSKYPEQKKDRRRRRNSPAANARQTSGWV